MKDWSWPRLWSKAKNNFPWILICIIILLLIALSKNHCSRALGPIIDGLFILLAAIATSIFAIHKYQSEQRTARLQKVYFEDTLLGQAKSIEGMKSQTVKNLLFVENLVNLVGNILNRKVGVEIKKNDILTSFDSTLNDLTLNFNITGFKKETISKLFYDSGEKDSPIALWIDKFETDAFRFSFFIKDQIFVLKPDVDKITDLNIGKFREHCNKLLHNYVNENYLLVQRHDILFHLFSNLVLEFSLENYTNVYEMFEFFKQEKIKIILRAINQCYKDLIVDFDKVDIGNISGEEAIRLQERIKCCYGKLSISYNA